MQSTCTSDIYTLLFPSMAHLKVDGARTEAACVWEGSSLAVRVQQSGCLLPGEQFRVLGNSPTRQQLRLCKNLMKTLPPSPLFISSTLSVCPTRLPGSLSICTHIVLGFNWIKGLVDQEITVIHYSMCGCVWMCVQVGWQGMCVLVDFCFSLNFWPMLWSFFVLTEIWTTAFCLMTCLNVSGALLWPGCR